VNSVADPECLSRIPDPDFYPSRILDPISRIQEPKRGVKKNFCLTFFCSHKLHIIENYFILEMLKKKILANFQRIIELFTKKIVTKLRDPEKNLFQIRDPGVKKTPDPGFRIRISNTACERFRCEHGASCMRTGIRAAGGHLLS
jgi:hypothetical protein